MEAKGQESDELLSLQQELIELAKQQPYNPNGAALSAYLNSMLQSCRIDALQTLWLAPPPDDLPKQEALRSALIEALKAKIALFHGQSKPLIQPVSSLQKLRTN